MSASGENPLRWTAAALIGALEEVLCQKGQLVAPLAERAQANDERGHGVVEVGPNALVSERDLRVEDGGADQPDGGIERGSQPRLQVAGEHEDLADQERRALAECQSRSSRQSCRMIGRAWWVRAFRRSEELALEDLGGQSFGIEGNERLIPAGAVLMDGAGDLPLARSRLTDDQDRGRRQGGQTDLLEQPAMGWAQAEQAVKACVLLELAPDLEKLDVQPVCLGVGHAGRVGRAANDAEQTDHDLVLVAEGPELDPAPDPLATGVEDQRHGAGMAGRPVIPVADGSSRPDRPDRRRGLGRGRDRPVRRPIGLHGRSALPRPD